MAHADFDQVPIIIAWEVRRACAYACAHCRADAIAHLLAELDPALAGNGYRGIGIPDCIYSGELAVEKIMVQMTL